MMDTLQDLVTACQANENLLRQQAQARTESWQPWLDLQWYTFQSLARSGQEVLSGIITADLKGLLRRLTGLETLAFNNGTPFADEVTLNGINQSVLDEMSGRRDEPASAVSETDNDIVALMPEAQEKTDNDGLDATFHWLQTRPDTDSTADKWLLRLLMARVARQKAKMNWPCICWVNLTVRHSPAP